MSNQLIVAIVCMFAALACYTIGVWSEKFAGRLKGWHLIFFWTGLVFDTVGTTTMSAIAGGMQLNLHGITGLLAIMLMLGHAVWATFVLATKQEKMLTNFHKFSIIVWLIWLVPFFTGMVQAMAR